MKTVLLKTDFENELTQLPYPDYPRPQFKRDSFLNLNGIWNFRIENKGSTVYDGEILVPFVPESRISKVLTQINKNDKLIYQRKFNLDKSFVKDKVVLNVGACDQSCRVFINKCLVGENFGGYIPFSLDITEFVKIGENSIKIIARDNMDINYPYGKQTSKRGGMWYTKISGIWQTVWIESMPENHIEKIKITPDLKGVDIQVFGGEREKLLSFGGREYKFENSLRINVEDPIHWAPEDPHLYEFTLRSGGDGISSYFALRSVGITEIDGTALLTLNGKPYFFNGLLDQGYFPDGIFLPASPSGFAEDIRKMKECGFNMLRKHIKIEPDIFYYYCDKMGMLVFQDFINNGKYSFFIDTALPTVGLKRGVTHKLTPAAKKLFKETATKTVELLHNHPCVVYYTIFNEGWGQHSADDYYKYFKALDPARIFDTTSGWFKEKLSDVESEHVYFKPIKLKSKKGRPLVLSEFGGYSFKVKDHSFNLDKNYGYRTYKTENDLQNGLITLYESEIIPAIKNGLSAAVLTQLSDVEDETNGLLTYDRAILKVDPQKMKNVADKLFYEFDLHFNKK